MGLIDQSNTHWADTSGEPRKVSVLGATGSIGSSTLDLIARNPDKFQAEVLTAHCRVELLIAAAKKLRPSVAVIGRYDLYPELKDGLSGTGVEVVAGPEGLMEAAARPSDVVVGGIVGAAGLKPTLEAAKHTKVLALANKECLVCAGELFKEELSKNSTALVPVDSEHSAIFQVFDTENPKSVDRVILTASGGPFRKTSYESMRSVTPEQAVSHPKWHMGAKISVDSATMMNKGLEVIEAYHLFPVQEDQIDVVVHPQSVIHSMVEYCDGSVLAQMGDPDMRTPIAVALAWPGRMDTPVQRLNFSHLNDLTFEAPDLNRFPCLALARQALRSGGAFPTLLNAANEIAVQAFLKREIGFLDIAAVVESVMQQSAAAAPQSLDEVLALDAEARLRAQSVIDAFGSSRVVTSQAVNQG